MITLCVSLCVTYCGSLFLVGNCVTCTSCVKEMKLHFVYMWFQVVFCLLLVLGTNSLKTSINEKTRYDYVHRGEPFIAVTGDSLSTNPTDQCGCQKLDYFAYNQTNQNKNQFSYSRIGMNVFIANECVYCKPTITRWLELDIDFGPVWYFQVINVLNF